MAVCKDAPIGTPASAQSPSGPSFGPLALGPFAYLIVP